MVTLYFRNIKSGDTATYVPCAKPTKEDNFVIEVTSIPENVPIEIIMKKLNETGLWNVKSVEYNKLGYGKMITKGWGGKREKSGRPSTGRKKQQIYVTNEELTEVRKLIEKMRESK